MKTIKHLILAVLCMICSTEVMAQSERNMVLHMKDSTVQKIAIASIDSISFEDPNPAERAPFKVELKKTSELYNSFVITPDDMDMTYNVFCEPKEDIDKYPSNDSIAADDKLYFEQLAAGYEMTIQECLSFFLINGVYEDSHTGLLPDHNYVMYMYGMTDEGEKTTPMLKVYFKTKAPEKISNKIAISYTFDNDSIKANYIPDDNSRYYTCGLFSSNDVPDVNNIGTQMQQSISNIITDYVLGDEPLTEYLNRSASKGACEMIFSGADRNMVYYLVAAYLDDECGICSDVTVSVIGGENTAAKMFAAKRSIKPRKNLEKFR